MERHIATISQQIASIKSQKRKKPERPPPRRTSKPAPTKEKKPPAAAAKEKKKRVNNKKKEPPVEKMHHNSNNRVSEVLPEFTFNQKKDLSERINNLAGDRLNTVVSIIQSSMPNLDGVSLTRIRFTDPHINTPILYLIARTGRDCFGY